MFSSCVCGNHHWALGGKVFWLKKNIYFNWRVITLQCCGFCHTSKWISHWCTYVSPCWTPPNSRSTPSVWFVPEHRPWDPCFILIFYWASKLCEPSKLYAIWPGMPASDGGENGNPPQYSGLKNRTDRGAWGATVHRVVKSQTQLNRLSTHARQLLNATWFLLSFPSELSWLLRATLSLSFQISLLQELSAAKSWTPLQSQHAHGGLLS